MIIKSIKLYNFGSYLDNNELEFCCGEKNITLVYAAGGSGKTTLLNAIKWCLYGLEGDRETNSAISTKGKNKIKAIDLLNSKVRSEHPENEKNFRVELNFEKDNNQYKVVRLETLKNEKSISQKIKLKRNGQNVLDPQVVIENIAPRNLNFFFEGEGTEKLIESGKDIKESIYKVLGVNLIENTVEDLKNVFNMISKEYDKEMKNNSEYTEYKVSRKHYKLKKEEKIKAKQQEREEETYLEKIIEKATIEYDKILKDSIDTIERQKELNELNKKINTNKNRLESENKRYYEILSKQSYKLFSEEILELAFERIKERHDKDDLPTPYTKELIKSFLDADECLCGTKLSENQEAKNKLESLYEKSENKKSKDNFSNIYFLLQAEKNKKKVSTNEIGTLSLKINNLKKESVDLEEEKESLRGRIGDENLLNKSKILKKEIGEKKAKLKEKDSKIRNLDREIDNFENKIKSLDKYIMEAEKKNKNNLLLKEEKDLAEKLLKIMNKKLELSKKQAKDRLEISIKSVYKHVNRNAWNVELTDNFDYNLINQQGLEQALIAGSERKNKALSFVGGLIMCAKNLYKTEYKEAGIKGGIYPLVLDGPFGELDEKYRIQIAKIIPELSEQVIIMVNSGQWSEGQEEVLKDKIGKKYELRNLVEINKEDSITEIKEVM